MGAMLQMVDNLKGLDTNYKILITLVHHRLVSLASDDGVTAA